MDTQRRRLHQRAAVIFRAASASGAGIAAAFTREGATVVPIEGPIATEREAETAIAAACASAGRLDILVNGPVEAFATGPLWERDPAAALHEGYLVPLWLMRAALPFLRERGGRIINVVSPYGDTIWRGLSDHAAAAEALKAATRSAAEEWGRFGILANALVPAVATERFAALRARDPAGVDRLIAGLPQGRLGDPVRDIGGAALLLATAAGRFITGHVLHADGGQHIAPAPLEAVLGE